MSTGEILTIAGVAERLKCSKSNARTLITNGRIKSFSVGTGSRKHYRVTPEAVFEFENTPVEPKPTLCRIKDTGIVSKRLMRRLG